MVSSNGSSPKSRHPRSKFFATLFVALTIFNHAHAALPDYVRQAINKFSADIPSGWAYTVTTQREKAISVERYDPSKPLVERWTLLTYNGAAPAAGDLEKYAKLKAANPTPVSQASFTKADIEPGSLTLLREDGESAEFDGTFRDSSTGADKMLGHLLIRLKINKRSAHIEKYTLTLAAPYSPILGVKMLTLTAQMSFSPPDDNKPSLPLAFSSDFTGKIFFIGTSEKLQVSYTDFVRVN